MAFNPKNSNLNEQIESIGRLMFMQMMNEAKKEAIKKDLEEQEENFQSTIKDFSLFAKDHLGLKEMPEIELVNERQNGMTTACYDTKNKTIKILRKNRALFDICRSIAHELVHRAQHERVQDGSLIDGKAGSKDENEANAVAGEIVRLYGDINPSFYE